MYFEGNILYFTPFHFKNGNAPKPKFFVVLKMTGGTTILASLPTSKDSVPAKDEVESGCVELPDINLNCFVLAPGVPVTECGKKMNVPTFIYGHEVDSYEVADMNAKYKIEWSDYEIFGKMKPDIFIALMECLKTSKSVKQKHLRVLNQAASGAK